MGMVIAIIVYVVGIGFPGLIVGCLGEDDFGVDMINGMFFWPLMLCALVIYGLYDFIRKVVRKFRAEK